jgi:rhodanese-related sulfurtransferase
MAQSITVGYRQLMAEAESEVSRIAAHEAMALAGRDDIVMVDIRDIREVQREGRIPGSLHAPRGMLEFWVDPESPYHKPVFAADKTFILYCASGWRSLLAAQALQRMGLKPVMDLAGGLTAWKEAGGAIEKVEKKS